MRVVSSVIKTVIYTNLVPLILYDEAPLFFACVRLTNKLLQKTHVQVTPAWVAFMSVQVSRATNGRDDLTDHADDADGGRYGVIDHATNVTDGRNNTPNHVSDCKDVVDGSNDKSDGDDDDTDGIL
jgi:hypothetical protein